MKKFFICLTAAIILCVSTVSATDGISFENATIEEIQQALSGGLISCEELTRYCLARIEQYNEEYNCFITLFDDALEQAKDRDEQLQNGTAQGALFGIPVVVKDNMDVAGYYTTNGYSYDYAYIAKENAYVVQALLNEGAIIIGKTNMSAGAEDAKASESYTVGHTGNAYNSLLSPGGSSGGTAAAISLNFAFLGLGTDTNSSLRVPAALNGCVSLRPTFGLISAEGIAPLNSTRDTAGAITDNVYDQALALDVLTGFNYSYSKHLNSDALDGARIGVIGDMCFDERADMQILDAFKNAIGELRNAGADVEMIDFPELEEYAENAFYWDDEYYREELYTRFEDVLAKNKLDVLIYPSILSSPIELGTAEYIRGQDWLNNTWMLSSTTGCPEITVPIGYHSDGSGIGMEIAALKNEEQLLLDIAYSYTNTYNHRVVPIEDESGVSLASLLAEYGQETAESVGEQDTFEETQTQDENQYSGAVLGAAAIIILLAFAAWRGKKDG